MDQAVVDCTDMRNSVRNQMIHGDIHLFWMLGILRWWRGCGMMFNPPLAIFNGLGIDGSFSHGFL